MGLNFKRVLIVLGVLGVLGAGAGVVYKLRYRNTQQATYLLQSAVKFYEAGQYDSARIEVDKLLRLNNNDADAHLLKGKILLAGRDAQTIQTGDETGTSAIRSFLKVTRLAPDNLEARRQLVGFFLGAGDAKEAGNHARVILRSDPSDLAARFALGSSLLAERQYQDAQPHLQYLLDHENPVRPRTTWLAAQLVDVASRRTQLREQVSRHINDYTVGETQWDSIDDQLALIELRVWKAQKSADLATVQTQIESAISDLKKVTAHIAGGKVPARKLLQAAQRLIPGRTAESTELERLYTEFEPKITALTDHIYEQAIEAKVMDAQVYVGFAESLRRRDQTDRAVTVMNDALEMAKSANAQVRLVFGVCDLWLAEHYLGNRQGEQAQPHLEALLATPHLKHWGQLLSGHRLVVQQDFDAAAPLLAEAAEAFPENGTAQALYGLCQLRRGFVSEGRRYLEQGIRLGAAEPQYKAWLSMALAQAGYQDQALQLAQQVLSNADTASVGRALRGQLRFRAGDLKGAQADIEEALKKADPTFRPALKLSLAELAFKQNQPQRAQELLDQLKQTPLAPQAYATQYRELRSQKKAEAASALLVDALSKHPDSLLLLSIHASQLAQESQTAEAIDLLVAAQNQHPDSPAPSLLLAEVFEIAGQGQQAIDVLTAARKQFPHEAALAVRLVETLLQTRRFDEAGLVLADLKGDEKVNPTTLNYLLARTAAARGDLVKAEEYIQKASEIDPDNPGVKFLRGQLAARQGDYAAAVELFEQSIAGGAFRVQALHALFESLLRTGETDRALQLLGQAELQGFEVERLRGKLLQLLARREKWDVLQQELDSLIRNNPTERDVTLAVSLLRFMKQTGQASAVLEKGIQRFPNSISLKEHQASLLIELGEHDKALGLLEGLLETHPKNPTLHTLKTALFLNQKEYDKALSATIEGWKQCPGNRTLEALRVQTLLYQGKESEATAFAQQAKDEHKDLPNPQYLVARMYEAIGNPKNALDQLSTAITDDPTDGRSAEHYLRLLLSQGKTKEFAEKVNALSKKNPNHIPLYAALAEHYIASGRLDEATSIIEDIESQHRSSPLTAYLKAMAAYHQSDNQKAESLLTVSLADPRGHIPSTLLLARIRHRQRRYEEALQLASQVCRQRSSLLSAQLLRINLFLQLDRYEQAERACRDYLEQHGDNLAVRALLAHTLSKRGGPDRQTEALRIVEEDLKKGVASASRFEDAISLLLQFGQDQKALTLIGQQQSQQQVTLVRAGAKALRRSQRLQRARELAQSLVDRDATDVESRLLLAGVLSDVAKQSGDRNLFEESVGHYRQVLKQDPDNLLAANNLAWSVGIHLGSPHRAMEELLKAIPQASSVQPSLPVEVKDTVGMLHLEMGHLAEARGFLEAAVNERPNTAEFHYHLGLVFLKEQRPDRAKQSFEKAKTLQPQGGWEVRIAEALNAN